MSVTEVNLVRSLGGSEDAQGNRTQSVLYQVFTSSKEDSCNTILRHPDLPQKGAPYRFFGDVDGSLFCTGREIQFSKPDASRLVYNVTVQYSTGGLSQDNSQSQTGNPLDMTPKIRTYTSKERQAFLKDLNGVMVKSSAGEPYDPVQERNKTRLYLSIVRNVSVSEFAFNNKFNDKVNSQTFYGFPPFTVLCETPGTIEVMYTTEGEKYYQETWEFLLPAWDEEENEWSRQDILKLYDYGMYRIEDGKRVALRDKFNTPLASPALLDGAGGVLAIGDDPVFLPDFQLYYARDFNQINLPQVI